MADKPKFRHGEPEVVDVHLPPEVFVTGEANFRHAETLASGGNTAMQSIIVEAARKLSGAPFIEPEFTQSEKEIFAILRETGRRLTKEGILDALEKQDGISRSAGTLGQTLSTLKRFGFLTNMTDEKGKGYGLREWSKS
jgi:hypothetical protein